MTTETYQSPIAVLDGLWKPFGKHVSRFLGYMGNDVMPVVGRVQNDEARQMMPYSSSWEKKQIPSLVLLMETY